MQAVRKHFGFASLVCCVSHFVGVSLHRLAFLPPDFKCGDFSGVAAVEDLPEQAFLYVSSEVCMAESPFKFRRLNTDIDESQGATVSPQKLCNWPAELPALQDKLISKYAVASSLPLHLAPGGSRFWITTSFSGLGTFEHVLDRMSTAFNALAGKPSETDHCPFQFWSAHDISPPCRAVLLKSSLCPEHVFGDICLQVPEEVRRKMSFIVTTLIARAEAATRSTKSKAEVKEEIDAINSRCMKKLFAIVRDAVGKGQISTTSWCFRHMQDCPLAPPKQAGDLRMEIGGNVCVAFTPQGNQGRWLHLSAIPASIWMVVTAHSDVDVVFQECSHRFNTEEAFGEAFPSADGWATSVLQVSPLDVGVPMRRPRNFSWTVNGNTVKLQMPFTEEAFLGVCGSQYHPLTGHDFFCAPPDLVGSFFQEVAEKRGVCIPLGAFSKKAGGSVLPTGTKPRLLDYRAHRERQLKEHPLADQEVVPIYDLSQNVSVRQKADDLLPSFLTGSLMWSEQACREMLPQEAFLAFGWPVPSLVQDGGEDFPFDEDEFFQMTKKAFLTKAIGNSVHCRVIGLLLAFGLAITQKNGPVQAPDTVEVQEDSLKSELFDE